MYGQWMDGASWLQGYRVDAEWSFGVGIDEDFIVG